MQQSEPLRLGRERQQTDAGGVAAGPVETGDEVELNRVWRWYVAQRMRGGLSGYSSSAGSPPSLRRSLRARRRSDMPKPSAVRAPLGPGSFPGAAPGDRPHACGLKLANDGHDTRALQHYLASWSLPIPSAMRASFYCPSSTRASAGRACVGPTRSDPDTTVLIPPIAFEPFDRPRRLIIGNHPPAIEPERGMVEAGVSERNRGVHSVGPCRVNNTRGSSCLYAFLAAAPAPSRCSRPSVSRRPQLILTTSTFAVALFSAPCSGRRSPARW